MFVNYKKECEFLRKRNERLQEIYQEQVKTQRVQRERIAFLEQELSGYKSSALKLFNQQTENEKTIAALQQDKEDLLKKSAHLDTELNEALRTIMNLENQVNSSRANLQNLCATLDDKEHHIQALDETLGKVQHERDVAEEAIVVLERRLKEVAAEKESALEAHAGICDHLEQREAKLADLGNQLAKKKHELTAAEAEIAALTAELTQMQSERKNAETPAEVTLYDIRHSAEMLLYMVNDLSARIADSI